MLRVLSRIFLGLALGFIPAAQAGLFGSLASMAGSSGSTSGDAPPPFDPAQPPASLAETFVKTYGLDKLKTKRVAITSFGVEFNRKVHVSVSDRNIITDTYSNNKTDFTLEGVPDEVMQRVADRAYDQFVADLQHAGFEVLPQETLRTNEAYQTLIKGAKAQEKTNIEYKISKRFDYDHDVSSTVVAPHGLQYYEPEIDEDEGRGAAGDNMLGVIGSLAKNVGDKAGRKIRMNEVEAAKSLDANILKARFVVGFGDASASTVQQHSIHTDYLREEVSQKLTTSNKNSAKSRLSILGRGESYIAFRTAEASPYHKERTTVHGGKGGLLSKMMVGTEHDSLDGNVTLWLAESVDSTDSFLADKVKDATTASQEADNKSSSGFAAATAKFGQFIGSSQSKSFVAQADPDLYEYLTSAYLDAVRKMFVAKLSGQAK
ncbi:MAG: hypothetical protein HY306_04190 [Nitrosomonadales bacterium]|nr:hypothetical protein [Nitrosomonadales bacterium]